MNRRERRAKQAHDRKNGVAFAKVVEGVMDVSGGLPETIRFSTAVTALRRKGQHQHADKLVEEQRMFGSNCPNCGPLTDPVLGIMGEGENARAMFGCPTCSGPVIREAWEREGMRS